jgi:hypothetical protein
MAEELLALDAAERAREVLDLDALCDDVSAQIATLEALGPWTPSNTSAEVAASAPRRRFLARCSRSNRSSP